jgi:hypothetical protein
MIAVRAVVAICALLVATPMHAQDTGQTRDTPHAVGPAAPPDQGKTVDPACGHMTMDGDGAVIPPPSVDPNAIAAARNVFALLPIDKIFDEVAQPITTQVDRDLGLATDRNEREALNRLKSDLPQILAVLKEDVLDTVATGIACHETKDDLDAFAGFMRTPLGQKLIAASLVHTKPDLTDDERSQMRDFVASDAGKHTVGAFRRGSPTERWMDAELSLVAKQIVAWLMSKYDVNNLGDPV